MILFSVSIIGPFGQRMHQKEVVLTLKINHHNQSEPCYLTIGPVRTNTLFKRRAACPTACGRPVGAIQLQVRIAPLLVAACGSFRWQNQFIHRSQAKRFRQERRVPVRSHKRGDERPGEIAKTCIIERWHEDNAIQDHNGLLCDDGIADDVCDLSHSRSGKYGQFEKRRAQNR